MRKLRRGLSRKQRALSRKMARASHLPMRECRLSVTWQEDLFTSVFFARQRDARHLVAARFDIDLGCRGIVGVEVFPTISTPEFEVLVRDAIAEPVDAFPELGFKIVERARDFAADLGFYPPQNYLTALPLCRSIRYEKLDVPVACGHEGEPVYVPRPGDARDEIIRHLESSCGEQGYLVTDDPRALWRG